MSYRDRAPSGGGLDSLPGFHVVAPGNTHRSQFLAWEKGKTVFRPYPEIVNGAEQPWREDDRPGGFSNWLYPAEFVKMCGVNDKFTCFVEVKGKDHTYQGPIKKFVSGIQSAIKSNARNFPQEWEWWVKGTNNTGRNIKIPRVETWGFIQGALFESAGKVFMNAARTGPDPMHPVLMCLTKSARIAVEMACNEEVPGYAGNPESYNERYVCGDVVSSAAGRLMQFVSNPGSNTVKPHYDLHLSPTPMPVPLAMMAQEWVPWDKLLHMLTEDEQMGLLISHFPAEPLDYVFKGTQWHNQLPPHMHGAFDRMPQGGGQPPSYQGVPPAYAPAVGGPPAYAPAVGGPPAHDYAAPVTTQAAPQYAPSGQQPEAPPNWGAPAAPAAAVPQGQPPVVVPQGQPPVVVPQGQQPAATPNWGAPAAGVAPQGQPPAASNWSGPTPAAATPSWGAPAPTTVAANQAVPPPPNVLGASPAQPASGAMSAPNTAVNWGQPAAGQPAPASTPAPPAPPAQPPVAVAPALATTVIVPPADVQVLPPGTQPVGDPNAAHDNMAAAKARLESAQAQARQAKG